MYNTYSMDSYEKPQTEFNDKLINDLFIIDAVYKQERRLLFSLRPRFQESQVIKILKDRLKMAGYTYELSQGDGIISLSLDPKPSHRIPPLNILLFLLTLLTVYIIPVYYNYGSIPETLTALGKGEGLIFTIAIISILFVHEMGHYIASRRRGIITSWPYFIPAPNFIGTFGAIIKSKSPFWNRRDLLEVGAAGPIAGWIIALGWLIWGLTQSELKPIDSFTSEGFNIFVGPSILTYYLSDLIIGNIPPGFVFTLSEAAFAGWVGLLVTAINMLPIGMLDGGHVLYGLMPEKQKYVGFVFTGLLIILGFTSPMWWFFAAFGVAFGINHPPTMQDHLAPSKTSITMGIVSLIILILSFTPVPFQ